MAVNINPQQGLGLNLDSSDSSKKPGQMTFVLNGLISNFDGQEYEVQNEQSTEECVNFPTQFRVIGRYNITQIDRILFFLTSPTTGEHEIGYVEKGECTYNRVLCGSCLNFSVDNPIHQIVVKQTNCGISVYWTDSRNSMRHFNFEDLPWVETVDPSNDFKKIKQEGNLDCNKLLVQPLFDIPEAVISGVEQGGTLTTGTYQFAAQYANGLGESYTAFYNPSNPISINQQDRATEDFDLPTDKAIRIKVTGLDTTGVFDYFNLVVIETVNQIPTIKLVGTYPIANTEYDILYTGDNAQTITLSGPELFQKFQHYDIAEGVTQSDDRIIWYNLKEKRRINYQPIASKIKTYWETVKIPYTNSEAYNNPINTYLYKGMMRDEVYPYEIVFLLKNGRQTDAFHIPGRVSKAIERNIVQNDDASYVQEDKCQDPIKRELWQVYNTATLEGTSPEYINHEDDLCYKGPYQWGEMAYWESEELYPNNEDIWGTLAGTPIRHHKFPDELVTPRFSTDEQNNEFIYPIGIKIDAQSLYQAIEEDTTLTQEEKDDIVGFKIIRGDRTAGNMSVRAKGHFNNVGKYEYEEQEYFFPNYPYNSLDYDPLFSQEELDPHTGFSLGRALRPFEDNQGKDQFTMHSPDTHFGRVEAVDTGYIKLESIDFGKGRGHFVPIDNNAEYKFMTQPATAASAALAAAVAFDIKRSGRPEFNGSDFAQMYTNMSELLEKLVPYQNFGYNINSKAVYNHTFPIPNSGNKIRGVDYGTYLVDGFNSIEDGNIINNRTRESSVYFKTEGEFLYPTEYNTSIPEDNSRFIASTVISDTITEKEMFDMMGTNNLYTMMATVMGIKSAADELTSDPNLSVIYSKIIASILTRYVDNGDYQGILNLEDLEQDCINIGEPPMHSETLSGIYAFTNPTDQTIPTITSYTGDIWLEPDAEGLTSGNTIPVDNTVNTITSNGTLTLNYYPIEYDLDIEQTAYIEENLPQGGFSDVLWNLLKGGAALQEYMPLQEEICGGHLFSAARKALEYTTQFYQQLKVPVNQNLLNEQREFDTNVYYGTLKSYLPTQWGRMYSYPTVDTGYYQPLYQDNGARFQSFPTIFGGDTFINKFSLKRKIAIYDKTTVGKPHQMDIALDENGNLGYPMFWISTKPIDQDFEFDLGDTSQALSGIGATVKARLGGSVAEAVGGVLMTAGLGMSATGVLAIPGLIVTAVGGVVYLIGKIFSNKAAPIEKAALRLFKQLINELINTLGIKNVNLDIQKELGIAINGVIYQYVYGIPTYFVESQVNVDYRQATNDNEGNFYPRVGTDIPDDWLQEDRVPIIHDNNYTYNKTFSKQNRENTYSHLREDFDLDKLCNKEFPNRAFWSEKANLNETLDNWLIYKPVAYHDFPKSYGDITALDGIQNRQVLARFTNKTQLYNALTTVDTSSFQAYLGNDTLFSTPPLDFAETDTGSLGSQHKFLLKTPNGIIYTDSKRGQIILVRGQQPEIISNQGIQKWLDRNLKFFISQKLPNVYTDNNFKGIGLHGVYDEFYDRFIITKLDYLPLNNNIVYQNGKFYLNDSEVQLSDKELFHNKSWTLSYSFKTQSWTSWHSYLPNYYVGDSDFFYSGADNTLHTHNTTYTSFTTYYGEEYPYIVEYPFQYKKEDEVIQSIEDYTTAFIYEDADTFYEPDEILYFNKALLYNRQQTTGILNLVPRPKNSLQSYMQYPKYNTDSRDILLDKRDNFYRFNTIKDISIIKGQKLILPTEDPTQSNIQLNSVNLQYQNRNYTNPLLRAKDSRVRLILDNNNSIKLISRILLQQTQTSSL